MNDPTLAVSEYADNGVLPFGLPLELKVTDAELVHELLAHPEGQLRDEYALCALKIGSLALTQARGQLDGETIKREGEKLLSSLQGKLELHASTLNGALAGILKDYFDPESGRFHDRVQRLVKKDGELEDVIRRQIGQQDSELCKTLQVHFGIESPLMKLLSPKESEGLLKALTDALNGALADQRKHVLDEFSLDNKEGALSRLVKQLNESHGDLNQHLQGKIDEVVKEFSLDKKDSALSRLVHRVTKAQRTISREFSLDNDESALSRMARRLQTASDAIDQHLTLDKPESALSRLKRELLELLNKHSETNQRFQEEVKEALNEMRVRRDAAQRSPLHGKEFEQIVQEYLQQLCQPAGEVVTFMGATTGDIKNCKIGDSVIEMGPEHIAAGARIVVEAKDKQGYTFQEARAEIEKARKNRTAGVGLFVFAKTTAPAGLDPFQKLGDDLFVVWDAEDSATDIYLRAGLMVARALCTRQAGQREANAADFAEIDKSILDIEKNARTLEDVETAAKTIKTGADSILKRVGLARERIDKQVGTLRELMGDLKATLQDAPLLT